MRKKIKVVWLCHICDGALNEHFGKEMSGVAPWMRSFIDVARTIPSLEVHIVSPNLYTNKNDEFQIGGIFFHLFKYCSGILNSRNTSVEIVMTGGMRIKKSVRRLVESIQPDVVHLFGAENLDYSEGLLSVASEYPTLITYQGFIRWAEVPSNLVKKIVWRFRVGNETTIYEVCKNVTFFSVEDYIKREFKKMFPGRNILRLDFPQQIPHYDATQYEKEYDIVYWGRVTKNKGIEDYIRAIAILKERKPDIKAIVIGGVSTQYQEVLRELVVKLRVKENIEYKGFIPSFDDVFKLACKARVYCLPTYFDAVPGSITEAMFLKLPVVTYPVGGIPFLNERDECVVLANERNVNSLAECIWDLLTSPDKCEELINRSYKRVNELCDNKAIAGQLISCYNSVLPKNVE